MSVNKHDFQVDYTYAVECLFQVKSKVGRALEELGKKDPRYNSVN